MLLKAKDGKPKDSTAYMQLAGYYNRQGEFDKTIEALQQRAASEPNNPEALLHDCHLPLGQDVPGLPPEGRRQEGLHAEGLEATDKALAIKSDYLEAIVYKGLLLRLQANIEKDRTKQQALLKEADELRDRAKALQKASRQGWGLDGTSYESRTYEARHGLCVLGHRPFSFCPVSAGCRSPSSSTASTSAGSSSRR